MLLDELRRDLVILERDVLVYHPRSRSRKYDLTIPRMFAGFWCQILFCICRVFPPHTEFVYCFMKNTLSWFPPAPPTSSFRLPTLELEAADVGVRVDAKHLALSFDQLSFCRGRAFFAAIVFAPYFVSLRKTMQQISSQRVSLVKRIFF